MRFRDRYPSLWTLIEFIAIAGTLFMLAMIGESQERYPNCGGTGVAIVGQWPAFSCTQYDDKCNIVVVPCSPAQRALIAFIGGHEVPTGNTAVSTRTPARRTGGGYSPKGTVSR